MDENITLLSEFEETELNEEILNEYDSEEETKDESWKTGGELPILPLRDKFLFPNMVLPVTVTRDSSLRLVRNHSKGDNYIAVVCQKDSNIEHPELYDIYPIGALAKIIQVVELNEGITTVVLQGVGRVNVKEITISDPYIKGIVEPLPQEDNTVVKSKEFTALYNSCKKTARMMVMNNPDNSYREMIMTLSHAPAESFINNVCSGCKSGLDIKFEMIKMDSLIGRAYLLLKQLKTEYAYSKLQEKIDERTKTVLDKQQKEYYLNQQIRSIQEELGSASTQEQDVDEMQRKAAKKKWSKEVRAIFDKEVDKLSRLNMQSPDYSVQLNYLQVMLSLPWGEYTEDNLDIKNAKAVLDKDHYGMDKVKERILEHLAVIKMRGDLKSPIICLYGPPGVGKTSLGCSIARALKRKYVRMSLGGVHDESEIRGHRKTYIGAMPGRIIKGIIKSGTDNPVFVLDEIDKVGQSSIHGVPSSALLEVLDPEQNNAFHDNFLDVEYDLSKVMFIATANNLNTIPPALLDRMEVIEVSGYLTEEKVEIARRHLIPDEMKSNGVKDEKISIRKNTISAIVENYTRESGVRELKKKLGKIFRTIAYQRACFDEVRYPILKPEHLKEILGPQKYSRETYQGNDYAGVVVGLAWTAVGGEILYIETSLSQGKDSKITLTGNLGDVMKESAILALEYVKSHASQLGIPAFVFEKWNIHLHVPEGAIPKDGPSAGITMATAIASAFTQRRVKSNLAMSGEITLRGKVLPVGGIKEKILAAKRAGIKEIILCAENRRDIEIIPEEYVKGLEFHYVEDISEVLDIALLETKVNNPLNLTESEI
ncbi:MAG: endopeptidase La [Bacteroidaceae bacterium]|nr:endopeptidase La [Bacteroidaceae bacterium]